MRISFFKTQRPRGFDFVPRYYDPVKENLERRRRSIRIELGKDVEPATIDDLRFREKKSGFKGDDYYNRMTRKASMRMIIVLLVSFAAAWYLLYKLDILKHITN